MVKTSQQKANEKDDAPVEAPIAAARNAPRVHCDVRGVAEGDALDGHVLHRRSLRAVDRDQRLQLHRYVLRAGGRRPGGSVRGVRDEVELVLRPDIYTGNVVRGISGPA